MYYLLNVYRLRYREIGDDLCFVNGDGFWDTSKRLYLLL